MLAESAEYILPNEPVEDDEPLISPLEDIAANNGFDVVATS